MKNSVITTKIILLIVGLLKFNAGFAQITKFENNLLKIEAELGRVIINSQQDSVNYFSEKFEKVLTKLINNNPNTLEYKFEKLISSNACDIATSKDGLFRIYSWDKNAGGSMHFNENLFQFKVNEHVQTFKTKKKGEEIHAGSSFSKIYSVISGAKIIYLAIGSSIFSGTTGSETIQAFTIEKGKLNTNFKIFKTNNNLLNKIEVEYDRSMSYSEDNKTNGKERTSDLIEFDESKNTIFIALITKRGKITNKNLVYKFDGQYFTFKNIQ